MKNLLFIPTYSYLSEPIFREIVPYFDNYITYYLDIEEQFKSEKTTVSFKNIFSKTIKLNLEVHNKNSFYTLLKIFKFVKFQFYLVKIIKEIKPKGVITTSDLSFSTRIIRKFFPSIPIFVIQPALFTNNTFSLTKFQQVKYLIFNIILNLNIVQKQNHFANEDQEIFLLLWGERFKSLIDNRHNKSKIKIVGDITLDLFPIKRNKTAKKEFLELNNFDIKSKIVVICTGAYGNLISDHVLYDLYEIYKKTILRYKNLFFIIKPHPRENKNKLIMFLEKSDLENVLISNKHLHELFKYTDIHISSFSRTGLEALASKIPIISVNPNKQIKLEDFFKNEINEKVINMDEMIYKMDAILKSTDEFFDLRKKYIAKMLYKLDGKSTLRAVDFIKEELLKNE